MGEAVGIVELFGLVAAFAAADAGCKAANVTIEDFDKNKPANAENVEVPLIMCIKMQGAVSAVQAGVEAAARAAEECTGLIQKHIIARPTEDSEKMALRTSVGRDRVGHIKNNA